MPLAGQLAHESCVHPGPLVLGTAFLKFPPAAEDRDRTVSRALPRITAGADYTFTLFPGAGVLWHCRDPGLSLNAIPLLSKQGSRYRGTAALATQMSLDICGGNPLRLRIV